MAIEHISSRPTEQFGRDFRQNRLNRAILSRVDIANVPHDMNPNYNADIKEATRIADWAVFSLYMDVLRRGEPGELAETKQKVEVLRGFVKGEFPKNATVFIAPNQSDFKDLPF